MGNFLLWVICGAVSGWIASLLAGRDEGFGLLGNVVVGIIGASIGGWLSYNLGLGTEPGKGAERPTTLWSLVWSILAGILLLWIFNLIW